MTASVRRALLGATLLLPLAAATALAEPSPLRSMCEAAEAVADIEPQEHAARDSHRLPQQARRQALREAARAEVLRELEPKQKQTGVQQAAASGETSHGLSAQARDSATQAQTARHGVDVGNGKGNGNGRGNGNGKGNGNGEAGVSAAASRLQAVSTGRTLPGPADRAAPLRGPSPGNGGGRAH